MATKPRLTKDEFQERVETNIGRKGLKIQRIFTKERKDIYEDMNFEFRTSKITNTDGSIVFEMKNIERGGRQRCRCHRL